MLPKVLLTLGAGCPRGCWGSLRQYEMLKRCQDWFLNVSKLETNIKLLSNFYQTFKHDFLVVFSTPLMYPCNSKSSLFALHWRLVAYLQWNFQFGSVDLPMLTEISV